MVWLVNGPVLNQVIPTMKNKISIRLPNLTVLFAGKLQCPNSLSVNDVFVCHNSFLSSDHKSTGDYFNLSDGPNIQPSHIYVLHIIINSSLIECMHSFCSCDNALIFEQKNLFVSLASKIHSFVNLADVQYLCKFVSRNSRGLFIYLKLIVPINILDELFKNILFSTQSKYGDDFFHFKYVSVRQKKGYIFKFTIIYIPKLIAGLFVINI